MSFVSMDNTGKVCGMGVADTQMELVEELQEKAVDIPTEFTFRI